jgi:hypothetical protein
VLHADEPIEMVVDFAKKGILEVSFQVDPESRDVFESLEKLHRVVEERTPVAVEPDSADESGADDDDGSGDEGDGAEAGVPGKSLRTGAVAQPVGMTRIASSYDVA